MRLDEFGEVYENYSLENYNTYGIKTKTKYFIKVNDIDSLINLMAYLTTNNLKYYVLGKGSNVILPDEPFKGVIISLEKLNNYKLEDDLLEVECGAILSKIALLTVLKGLSGLENLATIPGTIGGALVGNASFNKDITIYNNLISVSIIRDGKLKTLKKEEITIRNRYSSFKETKDILVKATFKLTKRSKEEMLDLITSNREKRQNTQPLEYRNAGSVFKNPDGYAAGKLIDDANLKGYQIGGAKISEKHANFIINVDNATSKDIKNLIKYIKKQIKEIYNIELELEQVIVDWN